MYICLYTSCTYTCILHVHTPVYCTHKLNTHCHVTNQKLYKSHPKGSGGGGWGRGVPHRKQSWGWGRGVPHRKQSWGWGRGVPDQKRSHIQTCNQLLNVHTKNNTHTQKKHSKMFLKTVYNIGGRGGRGGGRTIRDAQMRYRSQIVVQGRSELGAGTWYGVFGQDVPCT